MKVITSYICFEIYSVNWTTIIDIVAKADCETQHTGCDD